MSSGEVERRLGAARTLVRHGPDPAGSSDPADAIHVHVLRRRCARPRPRRDSGVTRR